MVWSLAPSSPLNTTRKDHQTQWGVTPKHYFAPANEWLFFFNWEKGHIVAGCFFATPSSTQGLFLVLCAEVTPDVLRGGIYSARDQMKIDCSRQVSCQLYYLSNWVWQSMIITTSSPSCWSAIFMLRHDPIWLTAFVLPITSNLYISREKERK